MGEEESDVKDGEWLTEFEAQVKQPGTRQRVGEGIVKVSCGVDKFGSDKQSVRCLCGTIPLSCVSQRGVAVGRTCE